MQASIQVSSHPTCEAQGCNSKATTETKIPLIGGGFVRVFLCKNCVCKWRKGKKAGAGSARPEQHSPPTAKREDHL